MRLIKEFKDKLTAKKNFNCDVYLLLKWTNRDGDGRISTIFIFISSSKHNHTFILIYVSYVLREHERIDFIESGLHSHTTPETRYCRSFSITLPMRVPTYYQVIILSQWYCR